MVARAASAMQGLSVSGGGGRGATGGARGGGRGGGRGRGGRGGGASNRRDFMDQGRTGSSKITFPTIADPIIFRTVTWLGSGGFTIIVFF